MNQPYAPTEPISFDRQTPLVPPWHDEIPTRIDPFSRDDCALLVDFYLRRLAALKNRIDPGLAAGLARMRDGEKHRLLGFVRMKDYTAECLDLDWRRARYLLTIHDAFQGMPLLARSFENGRLTWTKAREITSVADAETQGRWLDFASTTTVRLLAGAVRRFKADGKLPWEEVTPAVPGEDVPAGKAGQRGEEPGSRDAGDVASARIAPLGTAGGAGSSDAPSTEATGEADQPWTTFSCRVPPALRLRWEEAVEACRRQSDAETPLWECAEYMAAEILDTVSGLEGEDAACRDERDGSGSGGPADDGQEECGGGSSADDGHARPGSDCSPNSDSAYSDPSDSREADGLNDFIHTPTTDTPGRGQHPGAVSDAGRDLIRAGIENETGNWSFLSWAPMVVTLVGQLEAALRLVKCTASEASGRDGARRLHRALFRLVGDHEKIERYLGRLLRFFGDHRLHERCCFLSLRHYARERLGLSARQVGYLTSRERVFIHHPELEEAFLDGRVGSAKVRLLEPFARQLWPCNWEAWVQRAEGVTVRRLADEAGWAVDFCQRDPAGWQRRKGMPPAPGEGPYAWVDGRWHTCSGPDAGQCAQLDDRWHTCSGPDEGTERQAAGNGDTVCPAPGVSGPAGGPGSFAARSAPPLTSLIRFTSPPESAVIWSRAVEACRRLIGDDAPAWRCLEMIVDHFLLVWAPERDPDHLTTGYPNAVFHRDGWRCTVPGCRARSNLMPHHIVKRSHGGGDEMGNLITVCFHHHLEGIHRGLVWVNGRAPDQLVWELGRKAGEAPILTARGDWVLRQKLPEDTLPAKIESAPGTRVPGWKYPANTPAGFTPPRVPHPAASI